MEQPPPQETVDPLVEERAEDLYEDAPCGYLSTLPSGEIVKLNRTLEAWTGHAREDLLGRRFQDLLTAGGRIYHETHFAPLLRMQGTVREIALELICANGRRLPVLVNSVLRTDDDGNPLLVRTTVFDATHRREYERELLRARERERGAREHTDRLQNLSAALAAAVDSREMAEAVVAELADGTGASQVALALLSRETGRLESVSRHGPGPDPTEAWPEEFLHHALREGRPEFRPEIGAALPLITRGDRIGLVCLTFEPAKEVEDDERAFLEACARQCAQALDRARLFENQRSVAHTLQRSLLSGEPPEDPRFGVATCYLPAIESLEVGGDWYDSFIIGDDGIGVVVGDVVGRGIEAASAMGQLRSATRALAGAELGPGAILERLDGFVEPLPIAHMATVVCAEVRLPTGDVRYACAGHPPPLVMQPGQAPEFLWDGRSAPLGTYVSERTHSEGRTRLEPGARLVLYTDGLVETRRSSIDVGLDRLAATARDLRAAPLQTFLRGIVSALVDDDESSDDVCLLCFEYGVCTRFERVVPADVDELAALRTDLRRWLDGQGISGADRHMLVLACSEAAANAVEHGYRGGPGEVRVTAHVEGGQVVVDVSDDGSWREPSPENGRGRGHKLMGNLMDDLTIERSDAGTRVVMRRTVGA